jgi:hypothetical protein
MSAGPTDAQARRAIRKHARALHAAVQELGYLPEWQGNGKSPTKDFWFYPKGYAGIRIALSPTLQRASNGETWLRWDAILTSPSGFRAKEQVTSPRLRNVIDYLLAAAKGKATLGAHGASIEE